MPLIRFDLIEGRTDAEVKTLLDAAHCAMLAAYMRDTFPISHPTGSKGASPSMRSRTARTAARPRV